MPRSTSVLRRYDCPGGSQTSTPTAAAALEDALGRVGSFTANNGTGLLVTSTRPRRLLRTTSRPSPAPPPDGARPPAPADSGHIRRAADVPGPSGRRRDLRQPPPGRRDRGPGAERARLALVEPAARHHVAWGLEALDLLVRRSGGHPYYVQLFGWHSWEAAQGAPTITLAHAKAGLASARAELVGQYEAAWARLRPQERDYLAAVATLGGPSGAGVEEVAQALGKEPRQLAVARDRLVHKHGLLEVPERAKVCFVDGEMADWVAGRPDGASTTAIVHKGPARSEGQARGRPRSSPSRDAQLSQRRRPSGERPKDLGR